MSDWTIKLEPSVLLSVRHLPSTLPQAALLRVRLLKALSGFIGGSTLKRGVIVQVEPKLPSNAADPLGFDRQRGPKGLLTGFVHGFLGALPHFFDLIDNHRFLQSEGHILFLALASVFVHTSLLEKE